MKKLIRMAAVLAMFGLAACNSELGPEYKTMPEVSNLMLTPRIVPLTQGDTVEAVTEDQPVTLSCSFSNTYGWSRIYVCYRTLSPAEYNDKIDSEILKLWVDKFSSDDEIYKPMDYAVTFDNPVQAQPFTFTIPGQKAGTRVRWDFGYYNQYGMGAGYIVSGRLPQNEYTVEASQSEVEPIE